MTTAWLCGRVWVLNCLQSRPFTNLKHLLHHEMKNGKKKTRDWWATRILAGKEERNMDRSRLLGDVAAIKFKWDIMSQVCFYYESKMGVWDLQIVPLFLFNQHHKCFRIKCYSSEIKTRQTGFDRPFSHWGLGFFSKFCLWWSCLSLFS